MFARLIRKASPVRVARFCAQPSETELRQRLAEEKMKFHKEFVAEDKFQLQMHGFTVVPLLVSSYTFLKYGVDLNHIGALSLGIPSLIHVLI